MTSKYIFNLETTPGTVFLDTYDMWQYGFQKQHSTEYAAAKLVDRVSKEVEAGKTPANVYIDLSKAFDTFVFDVLLFKLKHYGVTGNAFDLM